MMKRHNVHCLIILAILCPRRGRHYIILQMRKLRFDVFRGCRQASREPNLKPGAEIQILHFCQAFRAEYE